MSEDEAMWTALEKIAETVFPERIDFGDIKEHLGGYNKQKAIRKLVERARQDAFMTKLKLHMVYTELHKLFNGGGS